MILRKMRAIRDSNTLDNINNYGRFQRSLNQSVRRNELDRIAAENMAIVRRIEGAKPLYSKRKFDSEWSEAKDHMLRISEFGVIHKESSRIIRGSMKMGRKNAPATLPKLDPEDEVRRFRGCACDTAHRWRSVGCGKSSECPFITTRRRRRSSPLLRPPP